MAEYQAVTASEGLLPATTAPSSSGRRWALTAALGALASVLVVSAVVMSTGSAVAGIDRFSSGFDAVDGTSKLPIFQSTISGQTWTNPNTGVSYQVPDEFVVVETPETFLADGAFVFRTASQYRSFRCEKSHSSSMFGMFSKDTESQILSEKMRKEDSSVAIALQFHSIFRMARPSLPPPVMDPRFEAVLSKLPAEYKTAEEKEAFGNFFSTFGTHYRGESIMGGKAKMTSAIRNCLFKSHYEVWVQGQVKADFGILSGGHGFVDGQTSMDTIYTENRDSIMELLGGNTSLDPKTKFDEWLVSVADSPAELENTIVPIHTLLTGAAAEVMRVATDDYIAKGGQTIIGCKDPSAANYDEAAAIDDPASCKPKVVPDCKQVVVSGGAPHEGAVNLGTWSDGQAVWLANGPHPTYGCVVSHAYVHGRDGSSTGETKEVLSTSGLSLVAQRSDDFCKRYGREHSVRGTVSNGVSCDNHWACTVADFEIAEGCGDSTKLAVTVQGSTFGKGCDFAQYAVLYQPHEIRY